VIFVTHAVGITIRTTDSCPHMRGAVIEISSGSLIRTFQHKASSGESADQLHEIAQALETQLAAQEVLAFVVREVGFNQSAGLSNPVKNRLRAEGVAVAIARKVTSRVAVLNVKAIARAVGKTSEDADEVGKALAKGQFVEPATAAAAAATL
jgi:hypothetical protein